METHEQVVVLRLATAPQQPVNEYKRFAILGLGTFGCIVCSFTYIWNLIATTMQARYNLSQRDMSSIVTVGIVFQCSMLPYAFLYDYFGPTIIAAIATVQVPLGTLLLALCFMGKVEGSVVRLCVFNALMGSGCILFDLACCVTVLSHFPTYRGPVVALMKTFSGLGTAIVACFYSGFFNSDAKVQFFFLFAFAIVVGVLCIAFMRLPPYHLTQWQERRLPAEEKARRLATKAQYLRQEPPLRRFVWGFIVLLLFIVYLPTQSALVSYLKLGKAAKLAFALVCVFLIAVYLVAVAPLPFMNSSRVPLLKPMGHRRSTSRTPESEEEARSQRTRRSADRVAAGYYSPIEPAREEAEAADEDALELGNAATTTSASCTPGEQVLAVGCSPRPLGDDQTVVNEVLAEEDGAARPAAATAVVAATATETETEVDYLAPQYQGTFLHNLTTLELWAMWWSLLTVVGSEAVIIFNATFIMTALQGSTVDMAVSTMLTVLNGVGSAVGRLLMSFFEVYSQKCKAEDRVPITIALFFPTTTLVISIIFFLTLPARALPLPYIIVACGSGFCAGAMLLVTRTIFAKDAAKHYNFCFTAIVISSVVFNRFLYGEWYTVQAEKQGHKVCYGKGCVLMPLLVMLGLACTAFITNTVFHLRYRSFCMKTLAERARVLQGRPSVDLQRPAEESVCKPPHFIVASEVPDATPGAESSNSNIV